jgi:cyclopropane fatty-acyl-phospholipid synthase-like methyltransferase
MVNSIVRTGHKILSNQICYDMFQSLVGSSKNIRQLTRDALVREPKTLLDLGCGTGRTIPLVSESTLYHGVDLSQKYLQKASQINVNAQTFLVQADFGHENWNKDLEDYQYDQALAWGLFHHLEENALINLLEKTSEMQQKNGLIFSMDPIIIQSTTKVARWVARNDRGQFLRTPETYAAIFQKSGYNFEYKVVKNSIRIPVDILLVRASKR